MGTTENNLAGGGPRPRICVITDGGQRMGMGHVQQSTTLAKALRGVAEVSFLTKSDEQVVAAIREAGFEVSSFVDDAQIFAFLQAAPPEVVLFDKIDVGVDLARQIRAGLPSRLVIFTNLTAANALAHMVVLQRAADLGTDPARRFRNETFTDPASGTRYFYGPRYWVLRPEFHVYRQCGKTPRFPPQRILLAFGGSDPTNLTSAVLDTLLAAETPRAIDVILGRHFAHQDALERVLERHPARRQAVTIHRNVSNVAELMYAADLAVTAAGMSMFEALCVGTPLIVIPQDDLQRDTYRGVMRLLEVDELGQLAGIIERGDFSTAADPIVAAMEIGDGLDELIDSILAR